MYKFGSHLTRSSQSIKIDRNQLIRIDFYRKSLKIDKKNSCEFDFYRFYRFLSINSWLLKPSLIPFNNECNQYISFISRKISMLAIDFTSFTILTNPQIMIYPLADTLVSGQLYLRTALTILTKIHSHRRTSLLTDTFFVSQGCTLTGDFTLVGLCVVSKP